MRLKAFIQRQFVFICIGAVAVTAQAFLASQDLLEQIYYLSRDHEDWELDEVFTVFITASLALLAALIVQNRRLSIESAARRRAEADAKRLAREDALTGLANRRWCTVELERRIATARREGSGVAVLAIDLDRFKPVNDAYGHDAGDELLRQVAERLRGRCRCGELVARVGGDEFVVLMTLQPGCEAAAQLLAKRLIVALGEPFPLARARVEVEVSASIGIAISFGGEAGGAVLKHADLALYRAKSSGRNCFAAFDDLLSSEEQALAALDSELRRAVEGEEIQPFFQPLVDLDSGRTVGAKASPRWLHPGRGVIEPVVFEPVAQKTGLHQELTWSFLWRAFRAAREWPPSLRLAVNISPALFHETQLVERLETKIAETGFSWSRLQIEVREEVVADEVELAQGVLAALKARGAEIALDDFGTGRASLTNLRRLPFDRVNIDDTLIAAGGEELEASKTVAGILSLTRDMGLEATAEGVETVHSRDWLLANGCAEAQGPLFAAPMPGGDFTRYLAERGEARAPAGGDEATASL